MPLLPKRKRSFCPKKTRRAQPVHEPDAASGDVASESEPRDTVHVELEQPLQRRLRDFARALWSSDYRPILAAEDEAEGGAVHLLGVLEQSSYRRKLHGDKAVRYDARAQKRARGALAQLGRVNNMRRWTFSIVARSLCYFNQRVPHRVWNDLCEDRRVCARSSCKLLLSEMIKVRPEPPWRESPYGSVMITDQTFCWQGCRKRRGEITTAERVDAGGMPVQIRSEVYVNTLRCRVPYSLCDFAPEEIQLIQEKGAYTEDFFDIIPYFSPPAVERSLDSMLLELAQLVRRAKIRIESEGNTCGPRAIMRALLAKPNVDPGGPTIMDWLPALKNCNTRSHDDLRRIIQHAWAHSVGKSKAINLFLILFGDGQTNIRTKDQKVHWPKFNK